jgi:adenosylmethionine-8-amino-7-oxononanoate aminotransferase
MVTTPNRPLRPARGGAQDLFYASALTAGFPRIVRGDGVWLWDDADNRYLDVAAGAFLSNLGQGNERVLRAMADQGRRLTYCYVRNTRHDANEALSERLAALAGPGFERIHLSSGGSEAIESALQLLRAHAVATGHPARRHVITLMPSYHGATLGALALTGNQDLEDVYGPMAVFSEKIPAPLTYSAESPEAAARATVRALEEAILQLGPETVLAFLLEPVGAQATGANAPPPLFFHEARRVCDEHGVRLVFDEVVSAFRTGRFLAAHHEPDALPDLVVLAKGIGAGYAPLGAVLAPARLVDELAELTGFNLSRSADANPIACAAGTAVLDEVDQRGLIPRAAAAGARLRAGLERIATRSPLVGDVRGRGLLLGVELVRDKEPLERFGSDVDPSDVVRRIAARHGLLILARRQSAGSYGDWFLVTPPLTISDDECDELLDRLERTLDDAAAELL